MTLELRLDRPLPVSLAAGSDTAIFCAGSCFDPDATIERLEIVVGGVAHPAATHGMPRPDIAALADETNGFFSGFWGTVPVPAPARDEPIAVGIAATLGGGRRLEAELGSIAVSEPGPATAAEHEHAPGTIAICMATFEPDEALLRAQIESLQAQTDGDWICIVSDDCSSPAQFARIAELAGSDPRFTISRSERRLGFYRNFERALALVPTGIELIALCDQDDRWHPDKLRVLRGAIGDAVLAYSDMRLVEADGRVLRETMWRGRRNNHDNLSSMLVANTITGASALFRRELLELLLPFPDTPGFQFHDHWLGVLALSAGRVAYVDRPLYDYVQHPGAVFGDVTHGQHRTARGSWRASYFYGYLARQALAQVALLRCESRLTPAKRRALGLAIACDRSLPALLWLLLRPLRALLGRTETLGTELELAQGLVWKRAAVLRARWWRHRRGPLSDASIPAPDAFVQKRLRRWRARV